MKELNEMEMKSVIGGTADAADQALGVLTGIGLGFVLIGLCATGPVGVAVGIMGECLGVSTGIAGMIKSWF